MGRAQTAKKRSENEVEFSRIVAFSDGVFAIAITLLVLPLGVEVTSNHDVAQQLLDEWDTFLAFAISFAVIGRFWVVHHHFFGEVTAFDGRLMGLNMVYLGWIVLIPFSSQVLGEHGGVTASVVLYSVNLAGVVILGWVMQADARRAGLTQISQTAHEESRVRTAYISGVFLLSIPVAFIAPNVAPFMWLALFWDPAELVIARRRSADRPGPGD